MAHENAIQYGRGTYSASSELDHLLGTEKEFDDLDYSLASPTPFANGGGKVRCRWVKNDSGGALLPAQTVVYKTGYGGKRIVDETATSGENPVGVVDEYLATAGVPDGANFWIVVEGPGKVINEASGTLTEFEPIKAGTSTGGTVIKNASTPGMTDVGYMLETTAVAGAKARAMISLRNRR